MISLRLLGGIASFCIGLFAARMACAQAEYQWTVYSALNSAQSVAFDDAGTLWIATTGGVVGYAAATDSYQIYHTRDQLFPSNEGLLSLNSTAIAFDPASGDMYVGSDDGLVSIRKKSGVWGYSAEISAMSERPSRTIRGFGFHNSRVYILTAFGIGVYNPVDSSFIESYLRFSQSIPQNTPVNAIAFWNGSIWVGTDKGLVRGADDGTNLAATDAWQPFAIDGAAAILSLAEYGDSLIVGTDSGAYMVDVGGSAVRRGDLPVAPVRLARLGEKIVAATNDQIYRYENGSFTQTTGAPDQIRAIAVSKEGNGGVGFRSKGFALLEGSTLSVKEPNAPAANYFSDLTITTDGAIWATTADQPTEGAGISRLKDGIWTIFNAQNTPEIKTDKIWNVGAGPEGSAYVGTFGGGLVVITPVDSGFRKELFNTLNTPAVGVKGDPFLVVGKSATDPNGRTWWVTFDPNSGNGPVLLARLRPGEPSHDGSGFEGFEVPGFGQARNFRWLAIDDNGTKWLGSDLASGGGLMYYNDRGTPTDPTDDDKTGVIRTDRGLPTNQISAIVNDKVGELWVGTSRGISALVNPASVVFNDANPIFRTIRPLTDIYVHTIAVDALNRKWVGTDQGIFLLSAEGDQVLAKFTVENSPLVNNQIQSILSVDATGDIYIGTTNGMNKVSTTAVEPSKDQAQLIVSPHPFVIPSTEPLRIKGLPSNATIKIFGAGMTLVREFQSPGGAVALWDGLDNSGTVVPSGVYIIAAGGTNGDDVVLGKVAVISR